MVAVISAHVSQLGLLAPDPVGVRAVILMKMGRATGMMSRQKQALSQKKISTHSVVPSRWFGKTG